MDGTSGQTPDHLIEKIAKRPYEFDFLRAVRLLECQYPDRPRIGYSISPAQDPIRFGQNPSLRFASSMIDELRRTDANPVPRLFIHGLGLFGPNGPLPQHYTEYAHARQLHHGDQTFTAFLNVFHHRMMSLFYRAWAANQKPLDLDRPGEQHYAFYIGSFLGLGMESLQERDAVKDWAKLYFAGRLACQTRNAEGLEAILQDFFEIKAEIQTFVGRWMSLPSDSLCQLGDSPETGSLGLTTIVGSRIWECQLNFRIKMGPMNLADYERMLPHGDAFQRLKYWLLNYVGEHFFWDVQLVLEAGEVPDTCLGRAGRLGWTSWLKTKPFDRDADDLVLVPPSN